jgi:DNA-binding XRE family transcriptional regulator
VLRNDHEHSSAKRLLIGLSAIKRGIAHMAQSYQNYAVGPAVSDLFLHLDLEMERVSNDIEQYQVGRFTAIGTNDQTLFALLERTPELPQCLIEARLALNWKQSDLAKRAGLKQQQLSKYESHNYANISLVKAIELSKVLMEEYIAREASIRTESHAVGQRLNAGDSFS